jgi:recombination protein RecR
MAYTRDWRCHFSNERNRPRGLKIESLVDRLNHGQSEIKEVILALSPTMEGDTTAFYINRRIKDLGSV